MGSQRCTERTCDQCCGELWNTWLHCGTCGIRVCSFCFAVRRHPLDHAIELAYEHDLAEVTAHYKAIQKKMRHIRNGGEAEEEGEQQKRRKVDGEAVVEVVDQEEDEEGEQQRDKRRTVFEHEEKVLGERERRELLRHVAEERLARLERRRQWREQDEEEQRRVQAEQQRREEEEARVRAEQEARLEEKQRRAVAEQEACVRAQQEEQQQRDEEEERDRAQQEAERLEQQEVARLEAEERRRRAEELRKAKKKEKAQVAEDFSCVVCNKDSDKGLFCCDICDQWTHASCQGYPRAFAQDAERNDVPVAFPAYCKPCLDEEGKSVDDLYAQELEYETLLEWERRQRQWQWVSVQGGGLFSVHHWNTVCKVWGKLVVIILFRVEEHRMVQ